MNGEETPDDFMRRALALAERGRRTVSPNPMVGCVLVRHGEIVGEGWHERAGGPHAEVVALTKAGERARGATAYVTLEPCNHTGRTGPCSAALVKAGVARVEAALADPNPAARGGRQALRGAGVDLRIGLCEEQARVQNRVFLHFVETGRPYVVLKAATSLDGRIAAADGTSQWLTGPHTRERVHRLRAEVDAVVVGSGTVLVDDPQLTARPPDGAPRQPLRVVLDARGRTPTSARVFDDAAPTLVVTTDDGRKRFADSVDVVTVPRASGGTGGAGGVDLVATLAALTDRGVRSALIEGGANVATSVMDRGLNDRLDLHLAPVILGDRGRPLFTGGPDTLADAHRLGLDHVDRVGDDVMLRLVRPASPDPSSRSF